MAQNKKVDPLEKRKLQSAHAEDFSSMNSHTGYKNTGNDAQVHAKARAVRQSENGSHM